MGESSSFHYHHLLSQFGGLVRGARRRRQITIEHLSKSSGITERRLKKYESASAPPHWADALCLAHVLDIRMSFIVAELKRPLLALSVHDYRRLVDFAYLKAQQQSDELRKDLARNRLMHWEDCTESATHDTTIAAWPELLPPFLDDAVVAEASRLHTMYQLLEMAVRSSGNGHISPDTAAVLLRIHHNLAIISDRLQSLLARHIERLPPNFGKLIRIQQLRIAQAMSVIAPISYEAASKPEYFEGESIRDALQDHEGLLMNLSRAMDRTILASYGLIKLVRRRSAVTLQPSRNLRIGGT